MLRRRRLLGLMANGMNTSIDCLPCVFRQALDAVRRISDDKNNTACAEDRSAQKMFGNTEINSGDKNE